MCTGDITCKYWWYYYCCLLLCCNMFLHPQNICCLSVNFTWQEQWKLTLLGMRTEAFMSSVSIGLGF